MLLNVLLMQYRAPPITQTKNYLTQMLVILELRNPALNGGFSGSAGGKVPACQYRSHRRRGFHPWVGKIPWERKWQPAPVFLPAESPGQRSLAGYSPWCRRVRHD